MEFFFLGGGGTCFVSAAVGGSHAVRYPLPHPRRGAACSGVEASPAFRGLWEAVRSCLRAQAAGAPLRPFQEDQMEPDTGCEPRLPVPKPSSDREGQKCLRAGAAALISGHQRSQDYGLFPCSHLKLRARPKMGETGCFRCEGMSHRVLGRC